MRCSLVLVVVIAACGAPTITAADRATATELWDTRCANCHGSTGKGDGPGAAILDPRPRDLTARAWQARVSDEHLARVIVDGGRAVGLSDQMAANPDLEGKRAVVAALVERIRALGP